MARTSAADVRAAASAHILLGAVVHHPDAHFAVGQVILLDAGAVIGRADPGRGIQTQVFPDALLMALAVHKDHLMDSMYPGQRVQTVKLLSKVPYFSVSLE